MPVSPNTMPSAAPPLPKSTNVPQAAKAGLARAVADRRAQQWLNDNQVALESSNTYVEMQGLPLAGYQQF